MNTSPHVLMAVRTCETLGWLRHVKGYTSTGEHIKAVAGQAWHAAVATLLDPKTHPDHDGRRAEFALAKLHDIFDPVHARVPADQLDAAYTPENLHKLLARWIEMHPPVTFPWKRVVEVETAFKSREFVVPLSGPALDPTRGLGQLMTVALINRPDIIVERFDGQFAWVDTKTTGWRISDSHWLSALRLSLQVQLYTDAMVQRFGDKAALGGWIAAVEIRQLPGQSAPKLKKDGTPAKERTCAEHGVPYAQCSSEHAKSEFVDCATSEERVAAAVREAEDGAEQLVRMQSVQLADVAQLDMRGTSNEKCRFCFAAEWCETAHRLADPSVWPSFVYEPWPVEEGQRA